MSADQIVDAIIADIEDRSGLGNAWEEIDPDIRREIRDEWIAIVLTPLGHAFPSLEAKAQTEMEKSQPEPYGQEWEAKMRAEGRADEV